MIVALKNIKTQKHWESANSPRPLCDPGFDSGLIRIWISAILLPKMSWILSLVGVSHFTKHHKNWPVTVWEMLMKFLLKSPLRWRKWKKVMWNPHADPDPQQKLITSGGSPLCFCIRELSCSLNDRMTDITTKKHFSARCCKVIIAVGQWMHSNKYKVVKI